MVSATASKWPPSAPIRSEEKNNPPRNPEPSEIDRGNDLEHEQQRHGRRATDRNIPEKRKRAMAGRHHLRRDHRQQPDQQPADRRAQRAAAASSGEQRFAQRHAAHDHDAGRRAQEPDQCRDDESWVAIDHPLGRNDAELSRRKRLRDQVADQRARQRLAPSCSACSRR